MKLEDLNLRDILEFKPNEGRLMLGRDRMLLFRQDALQKMWKLLDVQLGHNLSKSLISQFGYQCGYGDYSVLNKLYKWENAQERLAIGPIMHTWEGIVHVEPLNMDIRLEEKKFYFTGIWRNSFEAENYLLNFGKHSDQPVCHSLTGYASGWCSAFAGFPTVAIEVKCVGKGDDCCQWVIKDKESWGPEAKPWIDSLFNNYESVHKMLEQKTYAYEQLNNSLEQEVEKRSKIIEEQQAKLSASSRLSALGEMAGGIAHEINNPMAIISASAKILERASKKGTLDPETIETAVSNIQKTVDRVSKIISGLRTVTRESTGDQLQKVVLREILTDVLSLCTEKLRNRDIKLNFDLASSEFDVEILCDRVQLSQVFLNLISNSSDAIEDLVDKWIQIQVLQDHKGITIKCLDSGKGISPDIREKIFDPFFTSKEIGKGTGLGLSISSGLIAKIGGKLLLDTNSSNTCFVIEIPVGDS